MKAHILFLQSMIKIALMGGLFIFLSLMAAYLPQALAHAEDGKITCHTPRGDQYLDIGENKISFYKEDSSNQQRSLASGQQTNTFKTASGFTKTLNRDKKRYTIHIENQKEYSELNDYLSVRSQDGHEMIYPLICQ